MTFDHGEYLDHREILSTSLRRSSQRGKVGIASDIGVREMRVTGDVRVRRPRGRQRKVYPPRCRPVSLHARRRDSFSNTRG